ncbi:MAG: O-antigen ligase family protein [Patescibacteria group bacterium]
MPVVSLVSGYLFARLLSFLTYQEPFANQIIALLAIIIFVYFCLKNPKLGWFMLIGELLLDGAGHFFEFQGLLLRTWFLGVFGTIWLIERIRRKKFRLSLPPRSLGICAIVLAGVVILAIVNGFVSGHAPTNILQDAVLFFFILLFFPAVEFRESAREIFTPIISAWIIGTAIFSLLTFLIYSGGFGYLPDTYYHWFRNMAAGKITDLGNNFFRVVLPEQLFILPIILVIAARLINDIRSKKLWALLAISSVILILNFSRIYFLALIVGMAVLAIRSPVCRWFTVSATTAGLMMVIFILFSLLASRGNSFGLELLGLRASGISAPMADTSGAIRLAMLPDISHSIETAPWFGSGLGATVRYLDPVTKNRVTRTQFDWGYFEMLAELGVVGTIIFLCFIFIISYYLFQLAYRQTGGDFALARGLLAGASALLIANITTPALFHGFGILYIGMLMIFVTEKNVKC